MKYYIDCYNVSFIVTYFDATMAPVMKQLHKLWAENPKTAWKKWLNNWAQFSVVRLLCSMFAQVKLTLQQSQHFANTDDDDLAVLADLLPSPIEAVIAYSTYTYAIPLKVILIEFLMVDLGQW